MRTEITRKSKDAEGKLSVQRNNMSVLNSSSPQSLQSEAQDPSTPGGTYVRYFVALYVRYFVTFSQYLVI